MKKSFLIIIFLGITFLGCSDNFDNNLITTPIQSEELTESAISEELNKTPRFEDFPKPADSELLLHSTLSKDNFESEEGGDPFVNTQIVASKLIDGAIGGEIVLDTTYVNSEGVLLNVYARLKFDPGAFDGIELIEMVPWAENLDINLYPEMIFNDIVKLDYIVTGLDLESMGFTDNTNVSFVYFSPNGATELVANDRCNVHINQQRIAVQGAKLYHFSRYGWVR